jgi:hypothetical protein
MVALATNIACSAGGTTQVRVDFEVQRSGSSNDQAQVRVVRRINADGSGDVVLPSAPRFVLSSDRDIRGWTFLDVNLPADGVFSYVLQICRLNGGGTFYAMSMTAVHFRR